ncbi:MAG: hypothetical protein L6Q76_19945 [Polyangiaceae bacterium]|nr:hypothetical protein [Polyangiaceae bacterium]
MNITDSSQKVATTILATAKLARLIAAYIAAGLFGCGAVDEQSAADDIGERAVGSFTTGRETTAALL